MTRPAAVLFVVAVVAPVRAETPNGYSGMAPAGDGVYLVVKDYKTPRDADPRVGLLTVRPKGGADYRPIDGIDWKDADGPASDLEACCAVPGAAGEFFLAESGYFQGKFGRVFHVRLTRDGDTATLAVVRVLKGVIPRATGADGSTESGREVEGMSCVRTAAGRLVLALGLRGGKVGTGTATARLVWGDLDLTAGTFGPAAEAELVADAGLGGRGCADLLLEPTTGGGWAVWAVAADDGGDAGPFRSAVYEAGVLADGGGRVCFRRPAAPRVGWRLDGLKVEALARAGDPGRFCVATDDEAFGGVWRPLFPPR